MDNKITRSASWDMPDVSPNSGERLVRVAGEIVISNSHRFFYLLNVHMLLHYIVTGRVTMRSHGSYDITAAVRNSHQQKFHDPENLEKCFFYKF